MDSKKLTLLYTEIGRGHPFYLDGIVDAIKTSSSIENLQIDNVFDCSTGGSKLLFNSASWLYQKGGSDSLISILYKWLRRGNDYNHRSLVMKIMGHDIVKHYRYRRNPMIVAHPLLVGILAGRANLIYQHGELVAPKESLVKTASKVFVPTVEVADKFINAGYEKKDLSVTGLCIEPSIVVNAEQVYQLRCERIKKSKHLTGIFISSGAEPKAHIQSISSGIHSILRNNGKAVILAKRDGKLANVTKKEFHYHVNYNQWENIGDNYFKSIMNDDSHVLLCEYKNRQEENEIASEIISYIDYVVAPSHERTNWGLGLGLPFFILLPTFGPFAPLNCQLLQERVLASSVESSNDLYDKVIKFRDEGRLLKMAELGWGRYPINGFQEIVKLLTEWYCL